MQIRLGKDNSQSCPGIHKAVSFDKGEVLHISILNYPGKYHPWLPNNQYAEWSFWISNDVDLSPIFKESDIDQLILTQEERANLPEQLPTHSFEVIVQ